MGAVVVKRVLMVAFHYPPCAGSSGLQRALKFSRYLPEEGWEPIVLSAHPIAYPKTSEDQLDEIPSNMVVERSFCLDTARHLAIAGRYPRFLALPDRWSTWQYDGVRKGLRLINRYQPEIIWSTYPIATAHLIADKLQQKTGIPWVADFRDSMTEPGYPADVDRRRKYLAIEQAACERARAMVFNAPGAIRMYADRYPHIPETHWVEIANGYDDMNFPERSATDSVGGPIVLVHSGIIYPSERDPTHFFDALAELKHETRVDAQSLRVVLRATGHDAVIAPMLDARGLSDLVHLAPAIDYSQALEEISVASGLLLFQASNCNHQIPAKLYEYMRAGKPVLGITDAAGDTAEKMREVGLNNIVQLNDKKDIKVGLSRFLQQLADKTAAVADPEIVRNYSRRSQTTRLAELFDSVSGPCRP